MFKIISTGWNCADYIEWTLRSVEEQVHSDWEIVIIDDATPDPQQAKIIREWCLAKRKGGDTRWRFRINEEHLGAVRNQVEGIRLMKPEADDVIVFLDLDGDKLAHPDVLSHLVEAYQDNTLVTYGSYRPIPDMGTSTMASAFPGNVVQRGAYREWIRTGGTCFNHLRTMKGKVFNAIPEDQYKWPGGGWYSHGTDYIFMTAALELAGGRYKFLPEVLLLYNHANPNADYLVNGPSANACNQNYLHRPVLAPLVI